MEFSEFIRQCYLQSTPSVDLNEVTAENPINCRDYTIKMSVYDKLLHEYAGEDNDKFTCANMWCLMSGLRLINDEEEQP